jgi:hypothetical protein
MTKYQSEYNRNVDCMIKTDALHEHIRLLSDTLAVKEINEEKLTTQQQQMKKLLTLFVPPTVIKKSNDKKVKENESKFNEKILFLFRHLVGKLNDIFENHFHLLLIINKRQIIDQLLAFLFFFVIVA